MDLENYGIGESDFDRPTNESAKHNAMISHGQEFLNDMDALFWRQFWRTTNIADKYGLSRQRVSQVFKNIYNGISINEISKAKTALLKRELRNNCQLDPVSKKESLNKDAAPTVHRGLDGESIVFKKMLSLGLNATSSNCRTIDCHVNGSKVEIKTSTSAMCTNPKARTPYYRFNVSNRQINMADFFVFFIHDDVDRFFVMPRCAVSVGVNYIPKSTKRLQKSGNSAKNKFAQFEDAWHLLG